MQRSCDHGVSTFPSRVVSFNTLIQHVHHDEGQLTAVLTKLSDTTSSKHGQKWVTQHGRDNNQCFGGGERRSRLTPGILLRNFPYPKDTAQCSGISIYFATACTCILGRIYTRDTTRQ
jgi:hypothetical protein